jgi:peptidoglycan/LPS O-acetylase OafA/YrhL
MNKIELSDISLYRKPMMGVAILLIMLYHTHMDDLYFMYYVKNCGNVGVDIFLFLSGIGLWYSWQKTPSLRQFFSRRFGRVFPEFFVIACIFYLCDYNSDAPKDSHNMIELIGNITINWCFWSNGSRTFWFIPAIMAMYLFAPAYMNLIRKNPSMRWIPVLIILFDIFVQYNIDVRHAIGHLEIFINRIPIFLIGMNCGKSVKENTQIPANTFWLILAVFLTSISVLVTSAMDISGRYPILLIRLINIPLSITIIFILIRILKFTPQRFINFISFLGGISLEIYLVHEHLVLDYVEEYHFGYCLSALISIPIAIFYGWILHRFCHLRIWTKGKS